MLWYNDGPVPTTYPGPTRSPGAGSYDGFNGSATGSSASIPSMMQASNDATSHESDPSPPNATCQDHYEWPSNTEIILFPGTNKVMLTVQSPLMCSIFQDAFKHL